MKNREILLILAGILIFGLVGCGGGGGGGTPTTVISGTAAKGLVRNAKVQIFSITSPNTFALLKEGSTDANGNYSLDIGSYTGPVKVEVSGGQFKDETTGAFTPMLFALRSVSANVALGKNSMMVTGLTEIAVKKIEDSSNTFDAVSITEANRTVGAFFGVTDITGARPADVTVIGAAGDKDYGLALASLMQYSKRDGVGITKAFDDFSKLMTGKLDPLSQANNQVLADQIVANFLADKDTFLANPTQNLSGITGKTSATAADIRLKTVGTLPAGTQINALELTMIMPQGVTITAAPDGSIDTSSATSPVKISGVAAQTKATLLSGGTLFTTGAASAPNKLKLVIIFTTVSGFDVGEFATVTCAIAPNTVVTPGHFVISGFKAVTVGTDTSSIGARLEGVTPSADVIFR
jgi:hypothetical protein